MTLMVKHFPFDQNIKVRMIYTTKDCVKASTSIMKYSEIMILVHFHHLLQNVFSISFCKLQGMIICIPFRDPSSRVISLNVL